MRLARTIAALAAMATTGVCACAGCSTDAPGPASGGAQGGGPGASMPPAHERLDCDLPAVIEYCGGAACHYDNAAADVASSLALWDRQAGQMVQDVHTRLVAVHATYRNVPDPENCPPQPELLIDPSDIERSLVLRKLGATQQCGVEMPKFPYPEWGSVSNPGPQRGELVRCIRDWVSLLVEDYRQAL